MIYRTQNFLPAQVRDLCTYNPWSVTADSNLHEAIEQMLDFGFHHIPVVDQQRKPIGMLSYRDLATDLRRCVNNLPFAERDLVISQWKQRPVYSAMTPDVVSINISSDPVVALQLMLDKGFHALPVLEENRLIGVVTSSDYVREISFAQNDQVRRSISELMENDFEYIDEHFTLEEASKEFSRLGTDYLIVVQADFPLGVLSSARVYTQQCRESLSEVVESQAEISRVSRIGEMVKSVPMIAPGQRICDAAEMMLQHSLRSIAIVNQSSRVCGYLTEDRLLQDLSQARANTGKR